MTDKPLKTYNRLRHTLLGHPYRTSSALNHLSDSSAMTSPYQVVPVILCGGSGTRLWPLSRSGFPKQFLTLTGNESLFQLAVQRLIGLKSHDITIERPLIVTNEEHRFLATEQLREAGIELGAALLEPKGRNTAPALTLAALAATAKGEDPVLVVTPADQTIVDQDAFNVAMQCAIREAAVGTIVILGITPNQPETGYGYIQVDQPLRVDTANTEICPLPVQRFVEKPNVATAQAYLDEGNYYWNAGMFVLKASVWLRAIHQFQPNILEKMEDAWANRKVDNLFVRPDKEIFSSTQTESIDFAVMEHCPGSQFPIKMVPLDAGWSDLGAWDAVWKVLPKNTEGNAHIGDVLTTDSHNTLVHASSRLVCLIGVKNIIVVETADAVMVADMHHSQDVKKIVLTLQQQLREEHTFHRKVPRPWGWYDNIDEGERFKVKRIQVKPGASLSLQKHHHRAEHWIVVRGTAEVTCGEQVVLLTENQSTYIPLGETHRLRNPGTITLELIEVQSGSYLGEDDIMRMDDAYGRE